MDAKHAAGTFVGVALFLLPGCKSPGATTKEHFARTFNCPAAKVEVRPRPELHFRQNLEWQDEIFEARGCDYQTLYSCDKLDKDSSRITCSPKSYPPGISRW